VSTEKLHSQVRHCLNTLAQETQLILFNEKVNAHNTQIGTTLYALAQEISLAEEKQKKGNIPMYSSPTRSQPKTATVFTID
jgi:hypothetical protein